jgi:uncharacterized membrane protein YdjX (TVP38/TMEM64 family)
MKARKILILLVFAAVVAAFYFLDLGKYLTLESLKANRASLEDLRGTHAFLFSAVFVLIYIVQTAFSLPGAAILSLAAGAIFGVLQGTLHVVSGATVGAILAFLVSRTLLRDWVVKKFGGRMEGIDRGLRENGLSYLLFLRLVPAFPFFLVNLACGVTGLPLRTYALGTLFGIVPGSLVFVNAGASLAAIESVRQVASPRVLGSFVLLGLFALLPTIVNAVKKRRKGDMEMSLKDRLAEFDASRNRPPEVVAIIRRGIDYVRESGAAGLRIGERAPDFTLPNQRGEMVSLRDRLSRGPVVLNFYRGVW